AVSDLAPLAALTALRTLTLDQTAVRDLAPLAALTALETLWLNQTAVSDLAPLAALTALQRLTLDQTAVSDLAPLAALTALEGLGLNQTAVSDLAPLAALTALQRLELNQTAVSDLAPLAALTALQTLGLSQTAVSDLAPLAALTALKWLWLNQTAANDLAPLAGLTGLTILVLDGCRVADLRPIRGLAKLGTIFPPGLRFHDTPATRADGALARLAGIEDTKDRARETLAYLNTLPPWPEPLPWAPPETLPDIAPSPPAPDPVPRIDVGAQGLDLAASPIDAADLADPIKARLYARLPDAVATLLRYGNRYPEVAGPAKALADLTAMPFADADLLDIHLQLAALTDLRAADPGRPKPEQLDTDCRLALDAVLRIGPGVTLGHPDVDVLEDRLAAFARTRQPATVAEGERRFTGALADRADLATPRLREAAGQAARAGDEGRVAGYRRSLSRNVIRALGFVAVGLGDAVTGQVFGEIVLAAAQFLVLHRDAIMATAPAWGQTGYAWLEYILVRAEMILRDARSGNVEKNKSAPPTP
ncbi:MAG: hypothetical protein IOC80_13955, partial [Rhodobacter sp.]|nr:hypothetical protein [Rhodobacter sp.]